MRPIVSMNSNVKKQFRIENVQTLSQIRKIEFDLSTNFHNGSFKFNHDTNILQLDFKNPETVDTDVEKIRDLIKKVNPDIEVIEKEIKPTYRKVLLLENLDCANCAAKIERIAKRNFNYEFIVVDFASTRFIIESVDKDLIDNLEKRVEEIAMSVDANIKVVKHKDKKRNLDFNLKLDKNRVTYFILGCSI
ncbi:MAG: hypothetical protein GX661_02110, partial [Acholeplasmataceae bacterium]|nr:hypothetical protein [Acholeplasmataceae bacterium]